MYVLDRFSTARSNIAFACSQIAQPSVRVINEVADRVLQYLHILCNSKGVASLDAWEFAGLKSLQGFIHYDIIRRSNGADSQHGLVPK
jgi:hypothetical protein